MSLLEHLTLAALAAITVSVWTVRVALTASGRSYASAVAAVVEAMLFLTVFSRALDFVDSPTRLVAYAVGVGIGSVAGHRLDALFRSMRPTEAEAELGASESDPRPPGRPWVPVRPRAVEPCRQTARPTTGLSDRWCN